MSDAKSRFKRPERVETPQPLPNADRWIAEANGPPAPHAPEVVEAALQPDKPTPKPEVIKRLTIDIPEGLHRRVKAQCGAQGMTIADVVRTYLERKFPEPKTQSH